MRHAPATQRTLLQRRAARGDRSHLERAEEHLKQSLEIEREIGDRLGEALALGNLGNVYLARGEFDKAEEMLRKALEIEKKLGRLEGMGNAYGNLGLVAEQRGDLVEARKLWVKARDLFEKIGMPHMVEKHQGLLDRLPPDNPE